MSQLGFRLFQLCKTDRSGSFSTRASRLKVLNLVADHLTSGGYKLKDPSGLKPKHIEYLIHKWQSENLSASTIKNRMAVLRWTALQIGKPNIIAKSNDAYMIPRRENKPEGKAKVLDHQKLAKITDVHTKYSLRLQEQFGLRREECIKFVVSYADQKDHIAIKPSWAKGGRARTVPITTESQRQLLNELKAFAGGQALIRSDRNYVEQLRVYEKQTENAGICKNHGLRHQYVRERYKALTGWECPANGGPHRKDLELVAKQVDIEVRNQLTKELGHNRFNITYTYLGS